MSGVTSGLRELLGRLVPYRVDFEHTDYASSNDHVEVSDLNSADVISSRLKISEAVDAGVYKLAPGATSDLSDFDKDFKQILDLHQIVLDVDLPVHLVESSTPGHHHLYVELEHPVPTEAYFTFLEACAKIGLIEWGYYEAFKARGFSCVRLPWREKGENPSVGMVATPAEIPTENLGGLFDQVATDPF